MHRWRRWSAAACGCAVLAAWPRSGRAQDVVPAASAAPTDTPVARLARAVRFETVSTGDPARFDPAPFVAIREYLAAAFPRVHATLTREVVADYSLLYTWPGSDPDAPPMLLTSHLDVVPVPPDTLDQWEQPPFGGVVADGFLWGRGTLDNKSGVLATLEAVEALLAEGFTPRRTIYLAFGHDEEVGGPLGAAAITALLQERGIRVGFSLDEGMMVLRGVLPGIEGPVALVGIAEKGSLTITLTAHAAGGHSSIPPGDSAIGKLARAVQRLEAAPLPARLDGAAAALFDAVGPQMRFPLRTIVTNRWAFNGLLIRQLAKGPVTNAVIRTTTAVTMIEGGVKSNVLPARATATVNFRLLPGDTVDAVVAHVRASIADPDIALEVLAGREASRVSDPAAPAFAAIRRSVEAAMPDAVAVAPGLVVGGTDSKHYAKIADHSYRFVPLRIDQSDTSRFHGINERLGVENYAEMIVFYTTLIRRAAG